MARLSGDSSQSTGAESGSTTEGWSNRGRGRDALRPWQIPLRGWWDILRRVKTALDRDNLDIVSAGVAFYAFLAVFPGLAAIASLYGLISDPAELRSHLETWATLLPEDAWKLLRGQVETLVSAGGSALSFAFIVSLLITFWSSSKGMKSLIMALNIVYKQPEKRGFFSLNFLALGLSVGGILLVVLLFTVTIGLPHIFAAVGLADTMETVFNLLRWPASGVIFLGALAVLYRFGPNRRSPRWTWVSVGSVMSLALWLIATLGFSWYASNFASYNATYGSISAVIVLLMWFYISVYIVLLGAEVNAEMEHQTGEDTTVGEAQPMGRRGAVVADTEPPKPEKLF